MGGGWGGRGLGGEGLGGRKVLLLGRVSVDRVWAPPKMLAINLLRLFPASVHPLKGAERYLHV